MRFNYLFVLIVSAILIQSCSEEKEKTTVSVEKKTEKADTRFLMSAVAAGNPRFTVSLPGELRPFEEVTIYPKIKGFVRKIYVDRGSVVRKGQLLALLDAPEVNARYAAQSSSSGTAYQRFLFSRQSYQRLHEAARKSGAVATIELERAYAQYLGDSAAYHSSRSEASASGQLQKYLRITAPFDGVISERFVSEGALVGENSPASSAMFQLTQEKKLRLLVAIPEKQAQSLPAYTTASFSLIDMPGKRFSAKLSRNSRALDPGTKSLMAEFDVDNNSTGLRSGQYARVSVPLQRPQPTLWVPTSSVVQAQSGIFVIKNESNKARRVPVNLGLTKDSLVEVFGDLAAGDLVLRKGSEELKEGTRLQ